MTLQLDAQAHSGYRNVTLVVLHAIGVAARPGFPRRVFC